MKTGRPLRPYRGTARVARNAVGHREGAPYTPPTLDATKLPPRPPWLKLGARVALLTPLSNRCASGVVGTVYEIRPTEDGETWEVACAIGVQSTNRRWRLTEIALWAEAPIERNLLIDPNNR